MKAALEDLLRETEPDAPIQYIDPPFTFNAPDVAIFPAEVSGYRLLRSLTRRLGWDSLSGHRLLDFGCGVRFTRTIVNLGLEIGAYAGVDTNAASIAWLRQHVTDLRFAFVHLEMYNEIYNPHGRKDLDASALVNMGVRDYDAASMFSVITHQNPADAELIFAMLRECVVRNGQLYFTAFVGEGVDSYAEWDPDVPCQRSAYDAGFLVALLERTGWRVTDVYEPSGFQQHAFVCRK